MDLYRSRVGGQAMTQTSMALALAGLSFMMTVIWGTPLLRILRHFEIGKIIRVEGPERHFSKLGTPTLGRRHCSSSRLP